MTAEYTILVFVAAILVGMLLERLSR